MCVYQSMIGCSAIVAIFIGCYVRRTSVSKICKARSHCIYCGRSMLLFIMIVLLLSQVKKFVF